MPVYEFRCDACGHGFEHFVQSMHRRVRPECPKCQSTEASKQMSVFSPQSGAANQPDLPGCGMGPDGVCGRGGCRFAE